MIIPERSHPLHLNNTMSGAIEQFIPLEDRGVKLFTCGPSIYGSPHIGNYRTFLYEDILHRYLEYLGYPVERLINFTDIEDKAVEKADRNMHRLKEITRLAAQNFYTNTGLLHIKTPDFIPRSSTSIEQAVQLIMKLLNRKIAYRYDTDVFYDPLKFKGFGRLYGLDMSKWPEKKRRFRRDNYPGNRWNRGDFILWHGYRSDRDGDIFWETELGKGRPAWNIQDPAMITRNLGFQIDIACGGVDNLYRHHDYNIAVIEAVSGREFASTWLHGEHVLIDGRKMSKSKGNIIYPKDLLEKGISAAAIRFALITIHYRKKLNLTDALLQQKNNQCCRLQELVRNTVAPLSAKGKKNIQAEPYIDALSPEFADEMNNDLQVGSAVDTLQDNLTKLAASRAANGISREQWRRIRTQLLEIDGVLQVLFE